MATERFQIVREIARGGMGRVVEAIDLQLGRTVALKQALDDDPDARSRFAREVEITARLEHPSIVPVYDAGDALDGAPFYVMRKVSGAPLDRLLADAATLDDRLRLLPNLLAVADAVAHAHGRGVIHRDLKPSNVLVGELGETVVIDWGLAKIVGEAEPAADPRPPSSSARPLQTTVGAVIGTPGFMAPEQVTAGATDARTDVYALGACLYTVLAGAPPLAGLAEAEVMSRTVEGRVAPLAGAVAGVPPDLVSIVDKAMARDPRARYLDAGGLSEDLRRFLTGQLVASHRYGTGQRLVRWLRRHRAIVAVAGVAAAILIAVAVIAVRRILAAGDRTAAALARERDRSDELIVTAALDRIDADPTLAIATLQQLRADSPRWAGVGPAIAAARARGVAIGYPGPGPGSVRVSFAPDPADSRVLVSGDSAIQLLDLAAHTATVAIAEPRLFAEWVGPIAVVNGPSTPAFLFDPRSRARVAFPWPRSISSPACGARLVAFADDTGAIGVLDASGGLPLATAPVAIPIDIRATSIWISPAATWIAVTDAAEHARLLHRDGPDRMTWTALDAALPDGATSFVWDRAEGRLVFGLEHETFELDLATMARQRWTLWVFDPRFAGDRLLGLDMTTSVMSELAADGRTGEVTRIRNVAGRVLAVAGDTAIELEDARTIVLDRRPLRHVLRPPVEITQVFADAHGHHLIGVNPAVLVAWDLSDLVPDRTEVPIADGFGFVDDRSVVAIGGMDAGAGVRPVYRYDLTDHPFAAAARRLGSVSIARQPYYAPDGVVAAIGTDGTIEPVVPSMPRTIGDVTTLVATEPGHVLAGTMAGAIHDVSPDGDRVVATLAGPVNALSANGGWIAAMTTGEALWRRDPRGAITTATGPASPRGFAVNAHGDVVIATDAALTDWPAAGPIAVVAPLASPATGVYATTTDRFAVENRDGVLHLYDPATRELKPILPAATDLAYSRNGARAAALVDRAIVVADLATGQWWTVFDHVDVDSGFLALSADGDTLLVGEAPPHHATAIDRWQLTAPADPRGWVMAATNAQVPAVPRGAIRWRPLSATP